MRRTKKVRIYKIYEYPLAVLDKSCPDEDAFIKARQNLADDMEYIVESKFEAINGNLFTLEITEDPILPQERKIRRGDDFIDAPRGFRVDFGVLLDKLFNMTLEMKYGDLSYSKHPELYQSAPKTMDHLGSSIELGPIPTKNFAKEMELLRSNLSDAITYSGNDIKW